MPLATPSEALDEFGRNAGMDDTERPWLLSDWDVWVRNPYYVGPPAPHPEDDTHYDEVTFDEATGHPVIHIDTGDDVPF